MSARLAYCVRRPWGLEPLEQRNTKNILNTMWFVIDLECCVCVFCWSDAVFGNHMFDWRPMDLREIMIKMCPCCMSWCWLWQHALVLQAYYLGLSWFVQVCPITCSSWFKTYHYSILEKAFINHHHPLLRLMGCTQRTTLKRGLGKALQFFSLDCWHIHAPEHPSRRSARSRLKHRPDNARNFGSI